MVQVKRDTYPGEVVARQRRAIHSDEMLVALFAWFCTLPVIGLLILPRLGPPGALTAALIALLAVMLLCWGMCGPAKLRS